MPLALQDVIVSLAALGALVVLARRMFWPTRRSGAGPRPSCDACALGDGPAAAAPATSTPDARPLTLIRPARRDQHKT